MIPYQPTWLRGAEVYQALEAQGYDRSAGQAWLARIFADKEISFGPKADPAIDLFWIVSVTPDIGLGRRWVPKFEYVNWENLTILAPLGMRRVLIDTPIKVSRELLLQLAGNKKKGAGGRSKSFDFATLEAALRLEIKDRGWPDDGNDDESWQIQADVENWVRDFLTDKRTPLEVAQVRKYTSELLKKIKAGN
jgi:hypothetical protein